MYSVRLRAFGAPAAGVLCALWLAFVSVTAAQAQSLAPADAIKQGEIAEHKSDYARAIEIYSTALQHDGLTVAERRELLRKRGGAYEWAKKYPEAETDLNAAFGLDADDPAVRFRRGLFFQRRHRTDEALADFAAGKRLDPKDAWFPFCEGEVRAERAEHELAIAAFSEALALNPQMMRARLGRGSEYNYANMYADARADYDPVLADFEAKGRATDFLPLRQIGLAYLGRGYANNHLDDFARAKADFDIVLTMVPNSAFALKWRGLALEHLGDRAHALDDYRAALAIIKNDEMLSERIRLLEGR